MAQITVDVIPRPQFRGYLKRDKRWSCIVAHRRAGKTVACIQDLLMRAGTHIGREPRFAYVAPTYTQAKDVAWSYLKEYTSFIPGIKQSESELSVTLPRNQARIRLYGAETYDRLRGLYLDGCVIDEAGDIDPRAWTEVIRPALSDRKGWATFIGTPKGQNEFYRIWQGAQDDEGWFKAMLKASETGLIDEQELADARKAMTRDAYEREYECSFDAAVEGAYYAASLTEARKDGRVGNVAKDPHLPVRAFWDIGVSDACAIWVGQFVGREIRVLDYYEVENQPLDAHLAWLRSSGYENALCVLPHDGARRDHVTASPFEDHVRRAGFTVQTVANQGKGAALKRVEEARRLFPRIWFNERKCQAGLDALAAYHEKIDPKRKVGLGPNHDWASHGADAFGLMCVAYQEPQASRPKPKTQRATSPGGWMG